MADYVRIIGELYENPELKEEKALYVYVMDMLRRRLSHLRSVYPKGTLHAVAIKTNSLPGVLAEIVRNGEGLEAASFEEVLLAVEAGCPFGNIVFDSPAKTVAEIRACNERFHGMCLNVNSLQELERLEGIHNLNIGVRVNPLVDVDSPGMFDVSHSGSKFGIPISLSGKIKERILAHPNINGLHVHAGSEIGLAQGHIEAIGRVYDLAEAINAEAAGKIRFVDIGGGFPAKMQPGEQSGLVAFVEGLEQRCPGIFGRYQVITEYGRFVHAHNAFALSRVEYVLEYNQPQTLITHLGADLFLREVYSSHPPYHGLHILGADGQERQEASQQFYDVAGPLCFSGDYLGRNVQLPETRQGDIFLVEDCGANTISMWSQHCSREKIRTVMV